MELLKDYDRSEFEDFFISLIVEFGDDLVERIVTSLINFYD